MKKLMILAVMLLVISMTVNADTSKDNDRFCDWDSLTIEEQAAVKGMTVEKYQAALEDCAKGEKPMSKEAFMEGLEAKGITVEEYKAMIIEKFEQHAEEKGMTLEAYKATFKGSRGCCKK